uniref:Uncharacterized protein n=1 Tax=Rhizophora mucronata TaxID=61149 RepID=A0A2P2Q896_RHIMU
MIKIEALSLNIEPPSHGSFYY